MEINKSAAVVTGGTKGIGFAIAESLVMSGASVFVCSRTRSDVEQAVEYAAWLTQEEIYNV